MFAWMKQLIFRKKEIPDTVIDDSHPEDLEIIKKNRFGWKRLITAACTVILTVGALLGYVSDAQDQPFSVDHVAFITQYLTHEYTTYPNEERFDALKQEREDYLKEWTLASWKPKTSDRVLSSKPTRILVQSIDPLEVEGGFLAHVQFQYEHVLSPEATEGEPIELIKVMQVDFPYHTHHGLFWSESGSSLRFEEADAAVAVSQKEALVGIVSRPKLEGQSIETKVLESIQTQVGLFFKTYNENIESAQALVGVGVELPYFYHGSFDVDQLQITAKEDKKGVIYPYAEIPYMSESFTYQKVFYIELKEKTMVRVELLRAANMT